MQTTTRTAAGVLAPILLLMLPAAVVLADQSTSLRTDRATFSVAAPAGGMSVFEFFRALGDAFGLDVSFAADLRDSRIDLALTEAGPEEALDRACSLANLMWVALDERSVLVAEDTPQNRRRYEPQVAQTFYLEHARLADMLTLLRSTVGAKFVSVNERLDALTLRDSAARVALARRLIEQHDRAPAILEVDVRLLRLTAAEMEKAVEETPGGSGTGRLPSRLDPTQARSLERSGRITARPTLSFADGEQARIQIARRDPAIEGGSAAAFALDLVGRLHTDGAIELDAAIEADSAVDLKLPAEHRRLSSTARLEPEETWAVSGFFQAADETGAAEPDHLVVLLTPRVASPGGVQPEDRLPLDVGTETRLGLTSDER